MIFPLPLATFEELMLNEDRPGYPFVIFFRLRFEGKLDPKPVAAALNIAMSRHPLMRAKIQRKGRSWEWIHVDSPVPKITWLYEPVVDAFPAATPIDLTKEIGTQLTVVQDETRTDVTFAMHHVNCDGLGALSFINDWLVSYARESGIDPSLELPRLDEKLLAGRGRFGLSWGKFFRMARKQLVGLAGVRQFLMRKPIPLIPYKARPSDAPYPVPFPAVLLHTLTVEETKGLVQAAKKQSVTANDLLIRELFLAIGDWQKELGVFTEDKWLRMMIPVSLRRKSDYQMPAANIVSSIFIDRRGKDFADPDQLLKSINDEMQLIKNNELGYTFIFSLELQKRLPRGMPAASRGESCKTTTVLTNLGPILGRCPLPKKDGCLTLGNAVMREINILAPMAPYTCATFAVSTYADRLTINLRYDPDVLEIEKAQSLIDSYSSHVRAVATTNSYTHLK